MRKNNEDCIYVAKNITELLEGIREMIEERKNPLVDEALGKNIRKLEKYVELYISTLW